MSEAVKSVFSSVKDRYSSPIFGNYILSWLIWNWRGLYITLFVDEKFIYEKHKLTKIGYLYNEGYINYMEGLLLPALSTVFIIFAYPHLLKFVEEYIEKNKVKKKNSLLAINKIAYVEGEYHDLIVRELSDVRDELNQFRRVKEEKEAEVKSLRNELEKALDEKAPLEHRLKGLYPSFHQVFTGKMNLEGAALDKTIEIKDGYKYYEGEELKYEISKLSYHPSEQEFHFVKKPLTDGLKETIIILKMSESNQDSIKGIEITGNKSGAQVGMEVTFVKVKPQLEFKGVKVVT